MKKITSITAEQSKALDQYALDMIEKAYSTERCDRAKGEAAIRASYRLAGLPEPKAIAWARSPWEALTQGPAVDYLVFGEEALQVRSQVDNQMGNQVYAQVDDQVAGRVADQVAAKVGNQVDVQVAAQVGSQVFAQVRTQVDNQVYSQVYNQVADQVRTQVRTQVVNQVDAQVYSLVYDQVRTQVRTQVGNQVIARVGSQVYAQLVNQVDNQVITRVDDQVRTQVDNQVYRQVYNQVYSQVEDQVYSQVSNLVYRQVYNQVYSPVEDQVYSQVSNQVNAQVRSKWSQYLGGHLLSGWASWRLACIDVFELDSSEAVEVVRDRTEHTGPTWVSASLAVISDRPTSIHRGYDSAGNRVLHNDSGPAVQWADGWSIFSIEGVRVPEKVVMAPETITLDEIHAERNQEVQRIMRERYGMERWLIDVGATVISMDSVPIESWNESAGSIERALMRVPSGEKYVVASDGSTGRVYVMRAPNNAETPEDFYRSATGSDSSKCLAQG